jgi:glycosyltransferase involved in cell wall biosynthesis
MSNEWTASVRRSGDPRQLLLLDALRIKSMDKLSIKRKKILYLITKSNWGGAQRYVFDLALSLPQEEFETVVALGGAGPLADKLTAAGIRTISIPSLQRDVSLAKEIRAFREIGQILRTERPTILHINSSKAGVLGALIGRLVGVPKIIFTSHGWAFNEDRPGWQRFVLRAIHWLTVLLSHQTIAVSREVKRQMNWPFAQKKMVVIHNGRTIANLHTREEARAYLCARCPALLPYQNDFWSITIGELHPVKRHDAVIAAMKELVAREPSTRHIIMGGGEQEADLRKQISALGLEENVFLLGAVDEAAQYLKAGDMFVLASRSEAMAYVIVEACIAGLPVVATSVGGIPEVIDHGTSGLLVSLQDKKALFEAIFQARTDGALRAKLAAGALSRAEDFTLEKTLNQTTDLYNK